MKIRKLEITVIIITVLIIALALSTHAMAAWECYQSMTVTEEVVAQSQQSDSGSSMYTSDGYLKSSSRKNRSSTNSGYVSIGNCSYNNNSNSSYNKNSVIHYFTICEDNGRIVSIIEHK